MDQLLEIKTKMRFKDALRFNLYIAYQSIGNRIFSVLSMLSLGFFVFNMINGSARLDEKFAQSFALLIPPFIFFILIPTKVWKATGALIGSQILKDEVVYGFTKEKITLKTSQGEADIKWDDYVRIVETGHDFRFFMDRVQAQMIPKYSLTKEEIQKLRSMIETSAGSHIIKLK